MSKDGYVLSFRRYSRDANEEYILIDGNSSDEVMFKWINENPDDFIASISTFKIKETELENHIKESRKKLASYDI